jgi:hypothetical protein
MIDETPSMSALAVNTVYRADETPVSIETTTNMLRGTRKSEDSCDTRSRNRQRRLLKHCDMLTVALCSLEINVPRSIPCTG